MREHQQPISPLYLPYISPKASAMREHQQRGVEVLAASGEQCVAELRALEAEVAEQYKADEGALVAQAEAGG